MLLTVLRMLDLAVWGVVALCLLPAFLRSFSIRRQPCDEYKTTLFFVGLWMLGNYGVRIAADVVPVSLLYALNALALAIGVLALILVRQGRPNDDS